VSSSLAESRGKWSSRRATPRVGAIVTAVVLLLSLAPSSSTQAGSDDVMPGLDEQVQAIKSDVLAIATELQQLEEKLLHPSHTQVAVFVSLAQDDPVEGVLPELQVEPDAPTQQLPEVEVIPPPSSTPSPANPFPSYPSLNDIEFEGFGSALRTDRSIFDDPRHATVIDQQQLQERAPTNMIEALEREVGVLMQRTGSGQASPFVRGLTGPQTVFLIDGIRVNNSTFRFGPNQCTQQVEPR